MWGCGCKNKRNGWNSVSLVLLLRWGSVLQNDLFRGFSKCQGSIKNQHLSIIREWNCKMRNCTVEIQSICAVILEVWKNVKLSKGSYISFGLQLQKNGFEIQWRGYLSIVTVLSLYLHSIKEKAHDKFVWSLNVNTHEEYIHDGKPGKFLKLSL